MPGNEKRSLELLPMLARTTHATKNFTIRQGVGLILLVDITARAAAVTLTPKLSMVTKDSSGNEATVDFWTAAAAINSDDTTVAYSLYPGGGSATPSGYTEMVDKVVPDNVRLTVTHSATGTGNGVTYSVQVVELP